MKYIFSILLVCILSLSVFAQVEDDYFDPNFKSINDSIIYNQTTIEKSKMQSGLSAGSMFISGNRGNMFSSYVAPSVSYDMSNRFRLRGGVMFMQNNYFGLKNSEISNYSSTSYNSLMFVQGEYLLSPKVLLRGTIIKDMNNFTDNTNMDSYSIGMDYKIGEKSSVGFELQFNNGRQPFYHSPGFGHNFGNNHFYNINQ